MIIRPRNYTPPLQYSSDYGYYNDIGRWIPDIGYVIQLEMSSQIIEERWNKMLTYLNEDQTTSTNYRGIKIKSK